MYNNLRGCNETEFDDNYEVNYWFCIFVIFFIYYIFSLKTNIKIL